MAKYMYVEPLILGGMNTVEKIVAIHYSTYMCFFYGFTKCREIYLMKGSFVNIRTDMMAIPLLIVGSKMLNCSYDAFRLYALDVL